MRKRSGRKGTRRVAKLKQDILLLPTLRLLLAQGVRAAWTHARERLQASEEPPWLSQSSQGSLEEQ